jgi:hypothetical protein
MTVQEFKLKYPEYSHLEGDSLWNTMEDMFIQEAKNSGDWWEGIKDLGYNETVHDIGESTVTMRNPKFWRNIKTGEIISDEERHPKIESSKINILGSKMGTMSSNFYVFDLSGEQKTAKYEKT